MDSTEVCIESWLKVAPVIFLNSFDVRGRDSSSDGKHWSAKEPFGSRAFFRVSSDPTFLLINDVRREVRWCNLTFLYN